MHDKGPERIGEHDCDCFNPFSQLLFGLVSTVTPKRSSRSRRQPGFRLSTNMSLVEPSTGPLRKSFLAEIIHELPSSSRGSSSKALAVQLQ